jgi:hypothetical protein
LTSRLTDCEVVLGKKPSTTGQAGALKSTNAVPLFMPATPISRPPLDSTPPQIALPERPPRSASVMRASMSTPLQGNGPDMPLSHFTTGLSQAIAHASPTPSLFASS